MSKKILIKSMEEKLAKIIKEEGYQEMADGFQQALDMVKESFEAPTKVQKTFGFSSAAIDAPVSRADRAEMFGYRAEDL